MSTRQLPGLLIGSRDDHHAQRDDGHGKPAQLPVIGGMAAVGWCMHVQAAALQMPDAGWYPQCCVT